MKNIWSSLFVCCCLFFQFCVEKEERVEEKNMFNSSFIDSIRQHADSVYTKRYGGSNFDSTAYFENDGITTQVMKDSKGVVIIIKNKKRIYYAQYYENGQLTANYKLDSFGQYNGLAREYFENGFLKGEGNFRSGFKTGQWKNYNKDGTLVSTDIYNADGQKISTVQ